jgi:hypothetical protein
LLDNPGVKAHDGAIAHIFAAAYLTAGATIVAVEARQASYLNLLNRTLQLPADFDKPVWPRRICETVREAFITSAPRPYGPYKSLEALVMRLPGGPTP